MKVKNRLNRIVAPIKDNATNIVAGYIRSGRYKVSMNSKMNSKAVVIHINLRLKFFVYPFSFVNCKHNNPAIKMSPNPIAIPFPIGIWIKIGI